MTKESIPTQPHKIGKRLFSSSEKAELALPHASVLFNGRKENLSSEVCLPRFTYLVSAWRKSRCRADSSTASKVVWCSVEFCSGPMTGLVTIPKSWLPGWYNYLYLHMLACSLSLLTERFWPFTEWNNFILISCGPNRNLTLFMVSKIAVANTVQQSFFPRYGGISGFSLMPSYEGWSRGLD